LLQRYSGLRTACFVPVDPRSIEASPESPSSLASPASDEQGSLAAASAPLPLLPVSSDAPNAFAAKESRVPFLNLELGRRDTPGKFPAMSCTHTTD